MTNLESLLTLNSIEQLGSIRIKRLLEHFGSAENVFGSAEKELKRVKGIYSSVAASIIKQKNKLDVKKELELAKKNNVKIISILDKDYPQNLKTIYDPAIILYVKGKLIESDNFSIAIVGSRNASIYGINCAEKFAMGLSELGITIVSGMARGIDSASHRGALKAKARTIAVLGSGLLNIYPPENKELFKQIAEAGAVISEFPLQAKPLPGNFPKRNRIISGLSLGTIIVEAARNSGALITADLALEQGREVFAVPGKLDSATSTGVNNLIKQGAKLVTSVDDVISELAPRLKGLINQSKESETEKAPDVNLGLNKDEALLYNFINARAKHIDELIREVNLPAPTVMSVLMNLELRHVVKQLPGKLFVRNYAKIV